jgi:hypothetical protein
MVVRKTKCDPQLKSWAAPGNLRAGRIGSGVTELGPEREGGVAAAGERGDAFDDSSAIGCETQTDRSRAHAEAQS